MTKSKGAVKLLLVVLAAGCFNSCTSSKRTASENNKVKVFGVFASPKEEQFSGVIDEALRSAADAGKIEYSFIDRIGYDGEFDAVLSHICQKEDAAIVIGDGFGNEESIRRSAANCPNKVFAFSQDGSSIDPNLLVLENRVIESAYLAGMVAGGSTKTNIIGVVGARPLAQANRMANAFIAGARFINPNVTVKISFNGSYFDKSLAEDAALSQINSGVDVIYALCLGVTDAVGDTDVKIISNLGAQTESQAKYVLASAVWNIAPTIDHLIDLEASDAFSLSAIKSFSLSTNLGESISRLDTKLITPELVKKVTDQITAIRRGALKLETSDQQPANSISP